MNNDQPKKQGELAELIKHADENSDSTADVLCKEMELTPKGSKKTRGVVGEFIRSYKVKQPEQSNQAWLSYEFSKYPDIWKDEEESKRAAQDVVENIDSYEVAKQDLQEHCDKGLSRDNWLAKKIEQGAIANGANDFGAYAGGIESAINEANQANIDLMYRRDGNLSQQPNWDGFYAEQHHADTFNMDAAAKGSEYRAEVLRSTNKNSVDLVIRDKTGKIVRKYQSKYGADANATDAAFKKNEGYPCQRKLVPEGQDVLKSTDHIEIDGVNSKKLSKEEAVEQHEKQKEGKAKEYDWNEASSAGIAKNIGKQACGAALLAVGFQGVCILGRRIWNGLTDKINPSVEEDVGEFFDKSIKSATSTGLSVAVTGGVTVAVKSGWLGKTLKNTPAGRIASTVCVGIENMKILYRLGKGELTGEEALDQMGSTTCCLVGGIAGGAAAGAALGTVLGPVGTMVGGVVGGIAGSTVGTAVYEGGKKIVSTAVNAVKDTAEWASDKVSNFVSFFGF